MFFLSIPLAPGPPSNLKVDVLSSNELNALWDLPAEANGVITKYEVVIYKKGEKKGANGTFYDVKLKKSKLFRALEPFTSYMVEVQASTKAGRGNWSDPVEKRTYPKGKTELVCCQTSIVQHELVMYLICSKIVFITK